MKLKPLASPCAILTAMLIAGCGSDTFCGTDHISAENVNSELSGEAAYACASAEAAENMLDDYGSGGCASAEGFVEDARDASNEAASLQNEVESYAASACANAECVAECAAANLSASEAQGMASDASNCYWDAQAAYNDDC